MLISLKNLFEKEKSREEKEVSWDIRTFDTGMGSYPVAEASDIKVELEHTGKKNLQVKLQTTCMIQIPCDRCLRDVDVPFAISIEKRISKKNPEKKEDFEDTQYIVDDCLDVDKIIRDELLLAWPAKILCKEDCKGLCSVCGHDLNAGDCGCDREVKDPRMAAIQDIFKNADQ